MVGWCYYTAMALLMLFLIPAGLELLLVVTPFWRWRRPFSFSLAVVLAASSVAISLLVPPPLSFILVAINCYRIINLGRILEARMHPAYLLNAVRRSSIWLTGLSALGWGLVYMTGPLTLHQLIGPLAGMSLMAAAVNWLSLRRQLKRSLVHRLPVNGATLPTMTVAIPARNETTDLMECLQTVVASDYPKLEILVLDDHSRGKTSEIIRSFAHDGVRFIPGDPLKPNWLAKNQAYQRLAREANGELILFCGVDIRFNSDSLRQLVGQLLARRKQMISILPLNTGRPSPIQVMRYSWELAWPRRWFNRPPVLSSCWLIKRQSLQNAGGFSGLAGMVIPEAYFSRRLLPADGYSFLVGGQQLGINSHKPARQQYLTSIRTRYPQLHKRIELVALVSLLTSIVYIMPLPLAAWAIWQHSWLAASALLLAFGLQAITYNRLVRATYAKITWPPVWQILIAVSYDLWLLNLSMWRYEFSEVTWKGRNITAQVMHAKPHLHELNS